MLLEEWQLKNIKRFGNTILNKNADIEKIKEYLLTELKYEVEIKPSSYLMKYSYEYGPMINKFYILQIINKL